jgi:putative RecB family exonuclease
MARELYSHSRLSSFEDCPKKFQYRYLLRVPTDTESIEGFMGKRVHEVLERLYEFADSGRVPSLARVLERFRTWWDERYDPQRVRIVRTEHDAAHYREEGERCLGNYYRRFYPFDGDETLALEERVTFSLDRNDAYRVQGVIDRVVQARDGAIEIHDYKTSRRVPAQNRLDQDRQLALYQMGLAERYGADRPMRLVWHFLQHDRVRTSTRTPEQLETLRGETMALIDRIRAETRFEPRAGPLCAWCEFGDICPLGPGRRSASPDTAAPPRSQQPPLL